MSFCIFSEWHAFGCYRVWFNLIVVVDCVFWTVGPRELTGAVDLISHYKLLPHHQFFCKRSLPLSISDSHYLHNVVGDSEVMKGEGMQLDQLIQDTPYARETNVRIQPFDLPVLTKAFQLRETAPIDLSTVIFFAILRLTLDFSFHLVGHTRWRLFFATIIV